MEIKIELVEKLRAKTGVTYEQAKTALEECDGDLLEAIVNLERKGLVNPPESGGYYSSQTHGTGAGGGAGEKGYSSHYESHGQKFKEGMKRFFDWCGEMIHKGNINYMDAVKNGEVILSLPVTILVVLLLFAYWAVIPLMIVGLFLGIKYTFRGPEMDGQKVNDVKDKASQTAENIKQEIIQEMEQHERNHPDH